WPLRLARPSLPLSGARPRPAPHPFPTRRSSDLSGVELTGSEVRSVLAVTVTAAVLLTAKLAVCLPLAFRLRRPLVVMAIGFVWGFLADLIGTTAADVDGLAPLVRLTPFSSEHLPSLESTGGELLGTVAVSLVFIALMGLLAWLLFRRADVK